MLMLIRYKVNKDTTRCKLVRKNAGVWFCWVMWLSLLSHYRSFVRFGALAICAVAGLKLLLLGSLCPARDGGSLYVSDRYQRYVDC